MNFKLMAVLLVLIGLSACSSTGDKKTDESGVVVDERSVGADDVEGSSSTSGSAEGEYGAETQVIVDGEQYASDDLNDPESPLSNRVVYFEYDSSSVRPEDEITLQAHAAYLASHPNVTVRLEGHTDERGAREYNLALGERRALSIRQILMLQGASVDQFQVTSFGEERPAVDGGDDSAWSQNRRVEIIYLGQ